MRKYENLSDYELGYEIGRREALKEAENVETGRTEFNNIIFTKNGTKVQGYEFSSFEKSPSSLNVNDLKSIIVNCRKAGGFAVSYNGSEGLETIINANIKAGKIKIKNYHILDSK